MLTAVRGQVTAVIRADLPRQRALASLLARELRDDGVAVRLVTRAPGRVATRRALAGVDPGGTLRDAEAIVSRRGSPPRRARRCRWCSDAWWR